jgi:hypothetical protein
MLAGPASVKITLAAYPPTTPAHSHVSRTGQGQVFGNKTGTLSISPQDGKVLR